MDINRKRRTPITVPVRVMGIDAHGQTYTQVAHTLDVSAHGLRIDHADFLRKPDEVVTVVYGANRMRFRVVWIGAAGTPTENQAALEVEIDADDTASLGLFQHPAGKAQSPVSAPPATPAAGNRRAVPRYLCDRGVQVWKQGELVSVYGKLHDLSLGGCAIETPQPFPVGTSVRLAMALFGLNVRALGEVRTSLAGRGMGIKFTSVRPEDISRLHAVVGRLSSTR